MNVVHDHLARAISAGHQIANITQDGLGRLINAEFGLPDSVLFEPVSEDTQMGLPKTGVNVSCIYNGIARIETARVDAILSTPNGTVFPLIITRPETVTSMGEQLRAAVDYIQRSSEYTGIHCEGTCIVVWLDIYSVIVTQCINRDPCDELKDAVISAIDNNNATKKTVHEKFIVERIIPH